MLLPLVLRIIVELIKRPIDLPWRLHLRDLLRPMGRYAVQAICALAFLPYEAYYSLDAVVRTLTRLILTKRNLLQWHTSTDAEQSMRTDLAATLRAMWIAPGLSLLLGGYLVRFRPGALPASAPLLFLWLISPAIAWWLSRPLRSRETRLTQEETEFLEDLSRNTWRFFETFVGPEDNWLPPDNYQDYPAAVIAHRTSPTNIGLALLSNLAAYDFGYIPAAQIQDRTAKTFASMERLERFRGHFFNWYDTRTLEPLPPRYVSTVDSGNLAGHLLTLREGLLQISDENILPPRALSGLAITLRGLLSAVRNAGLTEERTGGREPIDGESRCLLHLEQLQQELLHTLPTLDSGAQMLARLATAEHTVITELSEHPDEQVRWWAGAVVRQAQAWLDELKLLAPLAALPPPPRSLSQTGAAHETDSMAQLRTALERINREGTLRDIAQLSIELSSVARGSSD